MANNIIENINIETFFNDSVYKSKNYDDAYEKYLLLNKNNIPCDDVFENNDEYLIFIDLENKEKAIEILYSKK